MCRNIRVLHHFAPPTSPEEIRAAALQYVRKVSGIQKPPRGDEEALARAVTEVAESTARLLSALHARGPARTREGEVEKAKARWKVRVAAVTKVAARAREADDDGR